MKRVVMCVKDWSEDDEQDFVVFAIKEGESDSEAIERAGRAYSPDDEFYIKETGNESL